MDRRIELHNRLVDTLGSRHVYFQPPETLKLTYPCIVYSLEGSTDAHADNALYRRLKRYTIIYITKDPDDQKLDQIDNLRYCSFTRQYVSDNLYHFVYTIYN